MFMSGAEVAKPKPFGFLAAKVAAKAMVLRKSANKSAGSLGAARILPAASKMLAPPPQLRPEAPALTKLDAKPGWLAQSIRVMDGDFTVPSDKEQLVDIVLGLCTS